MRAKLSGLIIAFCLLVSLGCTALFGDLSEEEFGRAAAMGETVASNLMRTLQTNLQSALARGDEVSALAYCSLVAQEVTKQSAVDLPEGVEVKRTSLQLRNPENLPDGHEEEALAYFQQRYEETGTYPDSYVQRTHLLGRPAFRYYKAIIMQDTCLRCHGQREDMDAKLLEAIAAKYPEDRATGYYAGDFRGLIRVTLPQKVLQAEHQ